MPRSVCSLRLQMHIRGRAGVIHKSKSKNCELDHKMNLLLRIFAYPKNR